MTLDGMINVVKIFYYIIIKKTIMIMKKPCINDIMCSKCINDLREITEYKEKSDIEIIVDYWVDRASLYCKENNLEITEFSIRKKESCDCGERLCVGSAYYIEIYFD